MNPPAPRTTDWTFHVAIVGATKTGKTELLRALKDLPFNPQYKQTLGSETGQIKGISNGETICLSMTSLSGQPRLLPITQQHLNDKHAIIITYAINNVASFKETQFWVQEASRSSPEALLFVVGTCTDVVSNASLRPVNGADALAQSKAWGARNFSVSCAKNDNIQTFRSQLMQDLLTKKGHKQVERETR
jgi:GTPase SAR1 family protein